MPSGSKPLTITLGTKVPKLEDIEIHLGQPRTVLKDNVKVVRFGPSCGAEFEDISPEEVIRGTREGVYGTGYASRLEKSGLTLPKGTQIYPVIGDLGQVVNPDLYDSTRNTALIRIGSGGFGVIWLAELRALESAPPTNAALRVGSAVVTQVPLKYTPLAPNDDYQPAELAGGVKQAFHNRLRDGGAPMLPVGTHIAPVLNSGGEAAMLDAGHTMLVKIEQSKFGVVWYTDLQEQFAPTGARARQLFQAGQASGIFKETTTAATEIRNFHPVFLLGALSALASPPAPCDYKLKANYASCDLGGINVEIWSNLMRELPALGEFSSLPVGFSIEDQFALRGRPNRFTQDELRPDGVDPVRVSFAEEQIHVAYSKPYQPRAVARKGGTPAPVPPASTPQFPLDGDGILKLFQAQGASQSDDRWTWVPGRDSLGLKSCRVSHSPVGILAMACYTTTGQ